MLSTSAPTTDQPALARALPRKVTLGLALLLLTRLALGAAYSFVVPVWEAYDEDGHFAYVRYLAKYRQLLDPADPEAQAVYERFQPPLYYLLVAPFVAGFDLGETQPRPDPNPFFNLGNAGLNYALHPPQLTPAQAEIERAVRATRLAGVLYSTLSVLFIFHLARRVWPRQPGPIWTATLLYAFWPQFLFNGSMVTNDLAVTAFSAGVLALAVQLVVEGFRPLRALGLGLCLAAAVLSKINALALVPLAVTALAFSLPGALGQARQRALGPWLVVAALATLLAGAVAALTSLEFVTGQVLQLQTLERLLSNLAAGNNAGQTALTAMLYAFRTFYASFGWGNVETWSIFYVVWTAGFGLGLLGLAVGAARRRLSDGRVLLLMALQAAGMLAVTLALVISIDTIYLAPGRYLLPALPGLIGLLVEGWRALLPAGARAGRGLWRVVGAGSVLIGWAMPLITLAPVYAWPGPMDEAIDVPAAYNFGGAIQLLGHQSPAPVPPGETAEVRVCWQAVAPVAQDYTIFVEAIGPDGQGYGRLVTYPGRGNYPTRFWTPGVPFCDSYPLPIEPAMPAPALAWARVSLLRTPDVNGERLPMTDAQGQRVAFDAYSVPLSIQAVERPPAPAQALDLRFGNALRLRGFSLALEPAAQRVGVTLQWEALRDLDEDYRVFVHLRDAEQNAYAQSDSAPRDGWYPTSLWRAGEVVDDVHRLTLPAGQAPPLSLVVGVVVPRLDERLPAFHGSGRQVQSDEVVLVADWMLGDAWALPETLAPPEPVFVEP